jgi:acetyl/propionyl-CoA carboxylase alpha subunit
MKTIISFFLEMNTRLQVEHQFTNLLDRFGRTANKVARGEALAFKQEDKIEGHAMELSLC